MQLVEDGHDGRQCKTKAADGLFWAACGADELAMKPAPEGLLLKFLLFYTWPIVPGLDTIPCVA